MEWLMRNHDPKSEAEKMTENHGGKVTCKEE